ncbi:MAG: hypothetical protein K8R58_15220 [Bacteroidales bacterium]|nr:hypothetical protein [Bacteroidales bacterium]
MEQKDLLNSTLRLRDYILNAGYRGYDPYDALLSPFFRWPVFRNRNIRFGAQQVTRRLPVNIRPLLFVKKGYNPVTLGLCIQAYSYLSKCYPSDDFYPKEIDKLIDELIRLRSKGYSGPCWGYDFDWEARYDSIPAFTPTIVATGFITNALFENYEITGNQKALDAILGAEKFIFHDLNHIDVDGDICLSYSPLDKNIVFNATMKGARLLAQIFSVTKDKELYNLAEKIVQFVTKYQKDNGAWIYSKGDARIWVDNYHTGYIIDCLDEYIKHTDDHRFDKSLKKGVNYYRQNFFVNDEIPKFYDKETYPVDCTAAAQSILSLVRFGHTGIAENVATWMMENMQAKNGNYYYRRKKNSVNKMTFMRWANAWMFAAKARLLLELKTKENEN